MSLSARDWIEALSTADKVVEHIDSKGAIIKFCVVETESAHQQFVNSLQSLQTDQRFSMLRVDSGVVDVCNPQQIVRLIAERFDVTQDINSFLKAVWKRAGYPNPDLYSANRLASELNTDEIFLRDSFIAALRQILPRSSDGQDMPALNRDFRNALLTIASQTFHFGAKSREYAQLIAGLSDWLMGTAPAHVLKTLHVQWKLSRSNATQLLRSMLALAPLAGINGSIVHLDFRALTNPEHLSSRPLIKYTRNRRMFAYQWLREIIDQTYMFDSTLIVVEVGPDFLDQSANGPGIGLYDALKYRVLDDVDTDRDNPSSVITRIAV